MVITEQYVTSPYSSSSDMRLLSNNSWDNIAVGVNSVNNV